MTAPAVLDSLAATLSAQLPDQVERDAAFGALTTWRVGGTAAVCVRVDRPEDLAVIAASITPDVARVVLGRGSNLLVADAGYAGLVIVLGSTFEQVTIGTDHVIAGGATPLPVLARQCAAAGRRGLGFYVGIPGSVGGAVFMNAGGHGRETRDVLVDATIADLDSNATPVVATAATLELGYRHSAVRSSQVVLAATFVVELGDSDELRNELSEIVRWRTEHQPGGANAGSVFRNPPGDAAARLIDEECGLRGTRVGGAVVSEKHANFIQADAGATAADVRELIVQVRDRVAVHTGVRLDPEVHLVGFDEPW